MKIEIEINDKELQSEMTRIIASKLVSEYSADRHLMKLTMADVIKEVIYSQKEEIISMVVNKSSVEIVKKGLPRLIEKL